PPAPARATTPCGRRGTARALPPAKSSRRAGDWPRGPCRARSGRRDRAASRAFRLFAEREQFHAEAVAEQVVHLAAQGLGQQQPGVAQEQGRTARQVRGQFPGARQEPVGRQYLGDEAQLVRRLGVEGLAGQQEIAAAVDAEQQRIDDVHAVAGTTSDGKCAESWNCAVSAASTISHKSGISEWRQAGPLIALITGTSISSSFISRCRPSQWMRSMRSIGGRVGKDEVPGVARGPENSSPVPVRITTLLSRSAPTSQNASGSSACGRKPQRNGPPSLCSVICRMPSRRSKRIVWYLFR